jgi:hypothetical protein
MRQLDPGVHLEESISATAELAVIVVVLAGRVRAAVLLLVAEVGPGAELIQGYGRATLGELLADRCAYGIPLLDRCQHHVGCS